MNEQIIMKSLDPLRAKKIFIRKKLGHTAKAYIYTEQLQNLVPVND